MPVQGKDNVSQPSHRVAKVHNEKKYKDGRDDTPSAPAHGGTAHPEKLAEGETISSPQAGGQVRPQKKDGNTSHADSKFSDKVGGAPDAIAKDRLHLDKIKKDAAKESR